jgi:hypothetical protein
MLRFLNRPTVGLCAVLALCLVAGTGRAADEPKPAAGPPIDVVICLDVSNSMDGLIGSAKAKLWDIVNDLAKVKPTPDLRVGLYSYGNDGYDKKVGWIRKDLDLTTDLDALYQKLNALTTRGGTEYVTRVCRDALEQQKWSEDKKALKLIFVCGNEPASQDPVVKLKEAAELAKKKGVIINPIFCGPFNHPESADWKEFATLAGGRFANIDQDKGTVAVATPFDKELAELSGKLNTTYLAYGKDGKERAANQTAQDANAIKAGGGAAATRATSKAGGLYRNEAWDLVDRLKKDPAFDVKTVPVEELCDEMKKMTPEEREKYVKEMLAKREAMQKQITELSVKRDEFLRAEAKKNPSSADKLFNEAVLGALREQAAAKGITIPKE